ncbi:MAG: hypothetical protein HFG40_02540 [Bacilli bacterium]|nr:hypothetical protein [Bacilli bacterium]
MGKVKKCCLFLILVLLSGCSLLAETWIYKELPNDYVIQKKSDTKMIIGKEIDGEVQTEIDGSQIGFSEYVSEFQKGKRYVGFKCVKSADNGVDMLFYIIDTQESDVYGPYNLESTYNAVRDKIVDEEVGDWVKTSTIGE